MHIYYTRNLYITNNPFSNNSNIFFTKKNITKMSQVTTKSSDASIDLPVDKNRDNRAVDGGEDVDDDDTVPVWK